MWPSLSLDADDHVCLALSFGFSVRFLRRNGHDLPLPRGLTSCILKPTDLINSGLELQLRNIKWRHVNLLVLGSLKRPLCLWNLNDLILGFRLDWSRAFVRAKRLNDVLFSVWNQI